MSPQITLVCLVYSGFHRLDKIFFHDFSIIVHDQLFCICSILRITLENVDFLH